MRAAERIASAPGRAALARRPLRASASSGAPQSAGATARVRALITKVNAAVLPGPADLAALDAALVDLVRANPTPATATSSLINGRWVLLYTASMASLRQVASATTTTSSSASSSKGRSGSSSSSGNGSRGGSVGAQSELDLVLSPLQLANNVAYKFFYDNVPVLAGAAVGVRGAKSSGPVKARGNFQVFDTAAGRVENQARFEVGGRQCEINVNGTAAFVQTASGPMPQRLRATFTSFDLVVDGVRRLSLPLSLLNPVGYVDTVYLDEQFRISIGDKGSLFVAAREGG